MTTTNATGQPAPGASAKVDRERVLKYRDLAARLCEPPIGYARPRQWNGYLPKASSDRRSALCALAQEAYERELNGGAWTPPMDLPDLPDPQPQENG